MRNRRSRNMDLKKQNIPKSLKPIAGMGFGVLYGRFSQKKKFGNTKKMLGIARRILYNLDMFVARSRTLAEQSTI